MRNRTVMIAQLLSQPCKRGSHFFAFQQRFHSLLVNFDRSSQILRHSSTFPGGMTTTPSASATIRSPGLITSGLVCSGEVNSTGLFRVDALVKVFVPRDDDPFAKT